MKLALSNDELQQGGHLIRFFKLNCAFFLDACSFQYLGSFGKNNRVYVSDFMCKF